MDHSSEPVSEGDVGLSPTARVRDTRGMKRRVPVARVTAQSLHVLEIQLSYLTCCLAVWTWYIRIQIPVFQQQLHHSLMPVLYGPQEWRSATLGVCSSGVDIPSLH